MSSRPRVVETSTQRRHAGVGRVQVGDETERQDERAQVHFGGPGKKALVRVI